jgi:SAM-dependent methyltransferase
MAGAATYDTIGRRYTGTRRPDPRLARALRDALGGARSVLNVGAGAGAYEPGGVPVVAVEPSRVMIEQRPAGAAPSIQGRAEALPFPDGSFDAALAVLTDHHWADRARGLRELRRVARRRVVLFNADPSAADRFWLTTDYLPGVLRRVPLPYREPGYWEDELAAELRGSVRFEPFPIPHDCLDGFYGAYWRRPRAYLEPGVRAGISVFARIGEDEVAEGMARLEADCARDAWSRRHARLLDRDELDLGYRIAIAEL